MMNETANKPNIITIPADPSKLVVCGKDKYHQARVAAYCRVSTEEEEQLSSYEAQMSYYSDKIQKNPNWEIAGIYADEGISGTSTKKRVDFLKMIKQCEKGKIDIILTKSISRFARNTVDTLQYIRKLRAINVSVIFEKESIDTSKMTDEIIITTMSMFAQAESESISKNVSWGIRNRFKNGHVAYRYPILGYRKGEDGKPVIYDEEATIVRMIYRLYLDGNSIVQIKKQLDTSKIKTASGNEKWSQAVILNILKNEKYIGDALLQKTYTADCMTKKVIRNDGYLPKYLVQNCHPAIIDRPTYNAVQEELARRTNKKKISNTGLTEQGKFSGKFALSEILICEECGTVYRRTTWSKRGDKKIVWRCYNRLQNGIKYCKNSPTIQESILHKAIVRTINEMLSYGDSVMPLIKKQLTSAISGNDNSNIYSLEFRIAELKKMMMELVDLASKSGADEDRYDKEFEKISNEIVTLTEILNLEKSKEQIQTEKDLRVDEVLDLIDKQGYQLNKYDDVIVRKLIECIKVVSKEKVKIIFIGGYELEASLTEN